ncbi:Lrp/AsnC family transcriptional regulator [Leucobacter luti]|uniref:Lrp/AsnC family transcriptional regulator n=1 Tax=Leucobacter luti TaxID=340320 RepID=UPI003D006F8B
MHEPLDELDRQITAALLRNGRASWRQIAKSIGSQERTVARRGSRLLTEDLVRVRALSQPTLVNRGDGYFARISCPPDALKEVASWLAERPETLWVSSLLGESQIVSECFLRHDSRGAFIEEELAKLPVTQCSFTLLGAHHRTVRGWHANILSDEQLNSLGRDESAALASGNRAQDSPEFTPDEIDLEIIAELSKDGRKSIESIASKVGIAKPTVRKRISQLQETDYLSIRAVVDPVLLGFPLETLVSVLAPPSQLTAIGELLAADWRTRWAATLPSSSGVEALVTLRSRFELAEFLSEIDTRIGDDRSAIRASPILTHYKRSDVVLPPE